ncbi:hypothetical protein E4U42_006622 [Claviceps africana]|uniref:F-box domain-containing protein n=1 Tax=Claviceps africana TaxID=83212 RepID=A0A8K0J313_9HYPO|nr:hypothetical protein E4U42_006622 [Claviceps africana]
MSRHGNGQRKTSTNILDLPTEILMDICASFCYHCHPVEPGKSGNLENDLRSLASVSRRFRSICLPLLMHVMDYPVFIWHQKHNPHVLCHVRKLWGRFGPPRANFSQNSVYCCIASSDNDITESLDGKLPPLQVDCPALKTFSMCLTDFHKTPGDRPLGVAVDFPPLAFRNLRSITISTCIVYKYPTSSDRIALLNPIFESAPALHSLKLINVRVKGDVNSEEEGKESDPFKSLNTPRNLRRLSMTAYTRTRSNREWSLVQRILPVVKDLEKIALQGDAFKPDILQHVLLHKNTLRVVNLKAAEGVRLLNANALSSFTVLDKLVMDQGCFYPLEMEIHDEVDEARIPRCLADVIPVSLRKLELRVSDADKVFPCLCVLAQDMIHGRFPNLRYIVIKRLFVKPTLEWWTNNSDSGGFLEFLRTKYWTWASTK